jgi:hypothetical protein
LHRIQYKHTNQALIAEQRFIFAKIYEHKNIDIFCRQFETYIACSQVIKWQNIQESIREFENSNDDRLQTMTFNSPGGA